MMEVMFDWKKDGVKLIEGGKKYPTARSYIIEFFLKERFPELWSEKVDSELTKKTHEVYEEIAKISELEEKIKELKKELSTPVEKNDYEELAGEKSSTLKPKDFAACSNDSLVLVLGSQNNKRTHKR